jgi:protein-S-isoprenylcysteine O-methyltransferase Ste14
MRSRTEDPRRSAELREEGDDMDIYDRTSPDYTSGPRTVKALGPLTAAVLRVTLAHPLAFHEENPSRPLLLRSGAWLFRQRSWIPVPLALALLFIRAGESPSSLVSPLGVTMVVCGEGLRLWAVRHIGVISRTRSDRLGPLVSAGPFGLIRNPLYVGNIALWVGFALSARLVWIAPIFVAVLGIEYHAIVRWEEWLLESRRGEEYRAYAGRVPRWIPGFSSTTTPAAKGDLYTWRETLFSERGTLVAIAVGYLLLWMKHHL